MSLYYVGRYCIYPCTYLYGKTKSDYIKKMYSKYLLNLVLYTYVNERLKAERGTLLFWQKLDKLVGKRGKMSWGGQKKETRRQQQWHLSNYGIAIRGMLRGWGWGGWRGYWCRNAGCRTAVSPRTPTVIDGLRNSELRLSDLLQWFARIVLDFLLTQ